MLPVIVYEGIGYLVIWQGQKHAERYTPWYVDAGIVLGTGYSQARGFAIGRSLQSASIAIGRATERAVLATGRHAVSAGRLAAASRSGAAARGLLATAGMYMSAVTAGYMIGAVVGTAISSHLFGKQGARHAIDFYTGDGKYGEYFDIVGNVNTIYNAYHSGNN